jgi:hypothetical protein
MLCVVRYQIHFLSTPASILYIISFDQAYISNEEEVPKRPGQLSCLSPYFPAVNIHCNYRAKLLDSLSSENCLLEHRNISPRTIPRIGVKQLPIDINRSITLRPQSASDYRQWKGLRRGVHLRIALCSWIPFFFLVFFLIKRFYWDLLHPHHLCYYLVFVFGNKSRVPFKTARFSFHVIQFNVKRETSKFIERYTRSRSGSPVQIIRDLSNFLKRSR